MAKTFAAMAEAAAAAPQPGKPAASQPLAPQPLATQPVATQPVAGTNAGAAPPRSLAAMRGRVVPDRTTARNLANRAQHLRRSIWHPLAVFSGALWLRVTGTFFALIASTLGSAAWRARAALHIVPTTAAARHFWVFVGFTALFGYFAVSSFLRANRRERRAHNRN